MARLTAVYREMVNCGLLATSYENLRLFCKKNEINPTDYSDVDLYDLLTSRIKGLGGSFFRGKVKPRKSDILTQLETYQDEQGKVSGKLILSICDLSCFCSKTEFYIKAKKANFNFTTRKSYSPSILFAVLFGN